MNTTTTGRRLDKVQHHLLICRPSTAGNSNDRTLLLFDSSDGHLKVVRTISSSAHGAVDQHKLDVLWQHPAKNCHDFQLLPGGNILCLTSWTCIVELTRSNEVVWHYDATTANGNDTFGKVEVHGIQRLPNGHTMITEAGRKRIIEVDSNGIIHHEVSLICDGGPHGDTRNARKLASGGYLVAHEADRTVREYSAQGVLVWEYEVAVEPNATPPRGQSKYHGPAGHGPESNGTSVYCALRLRNGNTLIGTGNGHRVIEVSPQKEIVWSVGQYELPNIQLSWVATVTERPNGNIVISNCFAGPHPAGGLHAGLIELKHDETKEVCENLASSVWSLTCRSNPLALTPTHDH